MMLLLKQSVVTGRKKQLPPHILHFAKTLSKRVEQIAIAPQVQ